MLNARVVGLRAQNKLATRRELSHFGLELFLKRGFANTTVDQIVRPLGIARRTFFRYFNTKEELVFTWYEDLTPELVSALRSRPKGEKPFTAVREALNSLLRMYDENPDWVRGMMRLLRETPSLIGSEFEKRVVWERALVAALIEREGRHAMSPLWANIVVGTALTAFTAALDQWYESGGNTRLRPIVATAYALALDL